ncbi:hypothetical protein [Novosphingobium arvoryzae]|uniref:Uncharacterized protein n=1 Tax=Novosphingobium arvoryzae TaxID=1256514 RepID=A0A918RR32_9SPHN|nr:hypothetical protein [Novosphingobium arvoryzae]GHA07309.1 hypothetical protein GCM10011617_29960 [Novosphingobium arvoryzae]
MKILKFILSFSFILPFPAYAQYSTLSSSKWSPVIAGDPNAPRSGVSNRNGSQFIVYDYTNFSLGDCKSFNGIDRLDGSIEIIIPAARIPRDIRSQSLGSKGISKIFNAVIAVSDGVEGYPIMTTVYGDVDGGYWTFTLSPDSQDHLDVFREIIPGLKSGVSVSFDLLSKDQTGNLANETFVLKGSSAALRGMLEQCTP